MPADPLSNASLVCAAQSIGSIQPRWSPWPGPGQCRICCCESLHVRKKACEPTHRRGISLREHSDATFACLRIFRSQDRTINDANKYIADRLLIIQVHAFVSAARRHEPVGAQQTPHAVVITSARLNDNFPVSFAWEMEDSAWPQFLVRMCSWVVSIASYLELAFEQEGKSPAEDSMNIKEVCASYYRSSASALVAYMEKGKYTLASQAALDNIVLPYGASLAACKKATPTKERAGLRSTLLACPRHFKRVLNSIGLKTSRTIEIRQQNLQYVYKNITTVSELLDWIP